MSEVLDSPEQIFGGFVNDIENGLNVYAEANRPKHGLGEEQHLARQSYLELLTRGGKHIRGVLAMNGYYMMGGEDREVAVDIAVAIEQIQTYILAFDDMQDRSDQRRGGPSAHAWVADRLAEMGARKGEVDHFAISYAQLGALSASWSATEQISSLSVDAGLRVDANILLSKTLQQTANGQVLDLCSQRNVNTTREQIEEIIRQKTSHYTILMPLQIGMVLAGASKDQLSAVSDFAINAGYAFQVYDDAKMYADNPDEKDRFADLAEGKMTLIIRRALDVLEGKSKEKVTRAIEEKDFPKAEYQSVIDIIRSSRAPHFEAEIAKRALTLASESLDTLSTKKGFDQKYVGVLGYLASKIG